LGGSLFCLLAKILDLNSNEWFFSKNSSCHTTKLVRKESSNLTNLEALFYGFTGLLDDEREDVYYKNLKVKICLLIHKHQLEIINMVNYSFPNIDQIIFPLLDWHPTNKFISSSTKFVSQLVQLQKWVLFIVFDVQSIWFIGSLCFW
jgi:hypothetical protein